jgi:hypothetical protein
MLMSDLANRSNDISAITMRREDEAHMKMKYEEQLDLLRKELKKEQSRLRQYDRFLSQKTNNMLNNISSGGAGEIDLLSCSQP